MTFFRLFQGRPTRFAMFQRFTLGRTGPKISEKSLKVNLGASPFTVKNNRFESFFQNTKKTSIQTIEFYRSKSTSTHWGSRESAATLTVHRAGAQKFRVQNHNAGFYQSKFCPKVNTEKKIDSNIRVLSVKVALSSVGPTREHLDPHRSRCLRIKRNRSPTWWARHLYFLWE